MPSNESWIYSYDPETKRQISQWKQAGSPRPKKARQRKSFNKLLMIPFFDSTGMIYTHWVPTGQTVNKEYNVKVLREFRKRFCDFWLFAKLRDCRYETIEEMKEAVTKVIDTLTQEDFHGAVQKLLQRSNKCIAGGGYSFEGD